MSDATVGIEEEVFVCEPEAPGLDSLAYLAKLTWSDPRRHYTRTASNFARSADVSQGLMSCVEISTQPHDDPEAAVDDLLGRRAELARAVGGHGLVVAVGQLLQNDSPTKVAALQFHVGTRDRERAYRNLGYALPLLALLSANAPAVRGRRFGQSYRMARGFAIGPLGPDPTARFQDLIVSKRLGTVEVRVLDPVWDTERVRVLARAIHEIARLDADLPFERDAYNALRGVVARDGWTPALEPILERVSGIADVPKALLTRTLADETWELFERVGLVATYSALDAAWRGGAPVPRPVAAMHPSIIRAAAGWAGYYLPKAPYVAWKYVKES